METTKTKNSSTTSNPTPTKRRQRLPTPAFSASDKAQAVLAVWTDRCKAAEVCRQLQINFMTFQHWQRRAMEGMLQALESRVNLTKGEALSPRLQALLSSRQKTLNTRKLTTRLQQIQLAKDTEPAPQS
jgi:transposase-like protein